MSKKPTEYSQVVRDEVVKSGLTGVAATVLAVTIFSPAGLGGLVGTSLASGFGGDSTAASDDAYANLPAFPAPLSQSELDVIHSQLARSTASLEITRAATDYKIEQVRSIAMSSGAVTFTPMSQRAAEPMVAELRSTTSNEVAFEAPVSTSTTAVSYIAAEDTPISYIDSHLELADLLLSR